MVWPVEAAALGSKRVLEVAVEMLDQAVAIWVVGGGGDVLPADGGAEGVTDGTAELRASVEVMAAGTPNCVTQAAMRAPAQ